jgi:hypothetical protein
MSTLPLAAQPGGEPTAALAAAEIAVAGLPPLAGLATYSQAADVGYDVEANVARLLRYAWITRAHNGNCAALACTHPAVGI